MSVKVDTFVGGLDQAAATAAAAKQAGYDGVWTGELSHDPFLPLAVAAPAAKPLDLGTSIVVAFARSPMTVAGTAWDLQAWSGGRFHLGLGSQVRAHIERRFSMPWSHPAPRMREFVLALRAIWASWQDGTPLHFEGDYYSHTLMTPAFNPGPLPGGPPKVLVAAVGTAMTRVAAEVADGLLVHSFTTRRYLNEVTLPVLHDALDKAGRTRAGFEVKYPPFVVTGSTEEEMGQAARAARERIAFYGSTPAYRPVLELHGWGQLQTELHELAGKGEWRAMGDLVDDEVLRAFSVVAPKEELPAALADWLGDAVDRTSIGADLGSPEEAGEVLRAFRAQVTARAHGR
ncbi:MAG TPA: TIGR03617 family F420-dependent LLM class oxidoreductase [Acidimicrobiales bacterium]|nr:TIGR03617 family F420-dependent LLM class oxidoreductase [Acidimicrobiales bacterium]